MLAYFNVFNLTTISLIKEDNIVQDWKNIYTNFKSIEFPLTADQNSHTWYLCFFHPFLSSSFIHRFGLLNRPHSIYTAEHIVVSKQNTEDLPFTQISEDLQRSSSNRQPKNTMER